MAQFVRTREGDFLKKSTTFEPHDACSLQEKALNRWEKQKHVWATVQENIRRRIADSGGAHVACINMSQGPYEARAREENIGLVTNAVPSQVFTGLYTWQSSLRADEADGPIRYLQVGKTNFPYALYGKVTDKRRRDMEHPINTRVVFQGENIPAAASRSRLSSPSTDTAPVSFSSSNYYKERLQRFVPENQQRVPHLLLPRAYLEVCGQPPPWTTNPDDAAAARNPSVPAFVHVQPLQPQPKSVQQESETSKKVSRPVSAKKSELHTEGVDFATLGTSEDSSTGVLSLDISTMRVFFVTQPGELAHGSVNVKNTGTVTVYYSWAQFQPVTALDTTNTVSAVLEEADGGDDGNDVRAAEKGPNDDSFSEKNNGINVEDETGVEENKQLERNGVGADDAVDYYGADAEKGMTSQKMMDQSKEIESKVTEENISLRSLAKRSALSKSFFFLSAQLDGVILPGDEETFSFSVRAAFSGRFTQYYELLTIPAVSSRIIIELCAIVRDGGHSLEAISRPIADALDASAIADAQRMVINELTTKKSIYEAVEIAKATNACIAAAKAAEEAQEALLAKRRKAWFASTYLAARAPFNRAVYERLDALYQNLARTMTALGQPLHHEVWDGSTRTLQNNICMLRDAPSRNMMREAFNILLRAANVSENETEPLNDLLRRAAGLIAFSTLAQHAAELSDSTLVTVGLSAPRIFQGTSSHAPHSQRGGGGSAATSNSAWGRKAAGGATTTTSAGNTGGGGKSHAGASKTKGSVHMSPDGSSERVGHFDKFIAFPEHQFANDSAAEALAKEEYNARLFTGMRRIVGDAVDRFCSTFDSFRCTIEAACALPLLEVTANTRSTDVHTIQNATEMEVNFAVDAAPPKRRK